MPAAACCFAALELGRRERAGRSGDASARGRLRRPGGARTCCSRWSARLGSRASWARCAAGPRCGTAATASRAWCDAATGGARAGAQARVRCFDRHAHVCLLCVRSSDNERTSLAAPYQGKSALHIVVFVHTLMKYLTLPQEHCLWVVSLQDIRCCVIHSTAPSEQPPHSAGDPKEARQNQGGAQHHQRRGRRAAQPGRVREDEVQQDGQRDLRRQAHRGHRRPCAACRGGVSAGACGAAPCMASCRLVGQPGPCWAACNMTSPRPLQKRKNRMFTADST